MKLRPRAEVFIFKQNRVLCAPRKGYIAFPGGGVDPNESAMEAAKRETMEESGRKLIHCTVAHPPTVQIWPKDYSHKKDCEGGLTYWMVGSASDLPAPPAFRHPDYEPTMDWRPVKEVIQLLKKDLAGDWRDDAAVRSKILETHLEMQKKHKEASRFSGLKLAESGSIFPTLNLAGAGTNASH